MSTDHETAMKLFIDRALDIESQARAAGLSAESIAALIMADRLCAGINATMARMSADLEVHFHNLAQKLSP